MPSAGTFSSAAASSAGIFFIDPGRARPDEDVDQLATRFEKGSVTLAVQAIRACLDKSGCDVAHIDL